MTDAELLAHAATREWFAFGAYEIRARVRLTDRIMFDVRQGEKSLPWACLSGCAQIVAAPHTLVSDLSYHIAKRVQHAVTS